MCSFCSCPVQPVRSSTSTKKIAGYRLHTPLERLGSPAGAGGARVARAGTAKPRKLHRKPAGKPAPRSSSRVRVTSPCWLTAKLIKLELVLTTATLFVSVYGVVASVFGMNLRNGSEDSKSAFVLVNVACAAGTVLAFVAAVTYIRFKRIV